MPGPLHLNRNKRRDKSYAYHGTFTAQSIALDGCGTDQAAILDKLVELQATHGNITDKDAYKKGPLRPRSRSLHLCGQRHHGSPRPHGLR